MADVLLKYSRWVDEFGVSTAAGGTPQAAVQEDTAPTPASRSVAARAAASVDDLTDFGLDF
jgi:hypothetical protein